MFASYECDNVTNNKQYLRQTKLEIQKWVPQLMFTESTENQNLELPLRLQFGENLVQSCKWSHEPQINGY